MQSHGMLPQLISYEEGTFRAAQVARAQERMARSQQPTALGPGPLAQETGA